MKYAEDNGYKVAGLARECYIDGNISYTGGVNVSDRYAKKLPWTNGQGDLLETKLDSCFCRV